MKQIASDDLWAAASLIAFCCAPTIFQAMVGLFFFGMALITYNEKTKEDKNDGQ